jgi:hypothetical protein
MNKKNKIVTFLFDRFLSENTRHKIEKIILKVAIFSFFIHLAIIYSMKFDFIGFSSNSELLKDPISAAYTPFSFILIYEVYLLIYYLPKSFTTYITKQYEIITLIIIRKLFKDLSGLELSKNWFEIKGDLQFTYDLIASLLLFYLIFLFQKEGKRKLVQQVNIKPVIERFVNKKKLIAVILVPLFFVIALYTLIDWSRGHKIIRNSGFVISTILIRMSFGVSGLISTILIVAAVLFGLAIIIIHNKYEKNSLLNNEIG